MNYLTQITDPGDVDRERTAVRRSYNGVRLHARIGCVTPDDEHAGRGAPIRQARRFGPPARSPAAARIPSQLAHPTTLTTPADMA